MRVGTQDVDAIIFDFDGTLADSMWVWDEVDRMFLAKRGIPFTDEFGEMIAVLGFELGADFAIEHFGLDEQPEDIIVMNAQSANMPLRFSFALTPGLMTTALMALRWASHGALLSVWYSRLASVPLEPLEGAMVRVPAPSIVHVHSLLVPLAGLSA